MEKKQPHLPDSLKDPKLPIVHADSSGNRMEQHRSDIPLPQAKTSAQDSL